jgi:MoCo/4Fe-4S cofactor protein with predicted Tat translocation signal
MPGDFLRELTARVEGQGGPRLWRSLDELADDPLVRSYIEAEFPRIMEAGAINRRALMRLMGASLALAGLGTCGRKPAGNGPPLLSQARQQPGATPGAPLFFATSLELDGCGRGVLVKSQDGRPIKIEGNPLHPASAGATDVFAQAEILSLYDPDRSPAPSNGGRERSWADFKNFIASIRSDFLATAGKGLHILTPPLASPTADRAIAEARRLYPAARWHRYAPLADAQAQAGAAMAFGRVLDPVYDLTRADAILTLGGDLFAEAPGHVRYAADYMARRRAQGRELPRLCAAETTPSLVGTRADRRLALPPRDIEDLARAVLAAVENPAIRTDGAKLSIVDDIAKDLRRAGSAGLVTAGREQPPVVHALAHAINARLGAIGSTVRFIEPVVAPVEPDSSIMALGDAIQARRVSALFVLGGNPAYDAPADLEFDALVRQVPISLHLGLHRDETSAACRWHVPQRHALENWGDLRAFDGTVGLRQPATIPLVEGFSSEEFLSLLIGEGADARDICQATWRGIWEGGFEARWRQSLEDGIVAGSAFATVPAALRTGWDRGQPRPHPPNLSAVFAPDPSVWDGRFANNGWLQELPKPLTKQVWGNAALIAPATAARLALRTGDEVELSVGGRVLHASVWVAPGHAPDAITLPLGFGRTAAGRVGNGVGFDAYRLRTSERLWIVEDVSVVPIGKRVDLVSTQLHHAMEGRDIVRIVASDAAPAAPAVSQASLYPDWSYEGHAWGMAVDLDACIGCNACVIACQAENNVAVVGPEQVARGREMHWLRVDRYFSGAPDEPDAYFQPVPCMHCEKAPCEVVCPVNATVHSAEGLNDMVYNRCIGTRTCSNNCPYKVRRFNFLDTRASAYAAPDDVLNPQVTVRERGVMEKCTYCVQRIGAARNEARAEGRPMRDGDIVTACQQACPTQAITFGDVNDPESAVSRLKREARNYALLGSLGTRPRTTYLARVERGADPADVD